jgi:ribonuclease Z
MSLARGYEWSFGDWNFAGYSVAGVTTSIFCRTASVCFDVGQGLPFQNSAKRILLTHGHLDHAAGLPYLLSQKNMMGQKETLVLAPPAIVGPLERILALWREIDGHAYEYEMRGLEPGEFLPLDKTFGVRPFATPHRVPSQGYLLYQKKSRLREGLREAGPEAILAERRAGRNPNEETWEPMVAFTGDTKSEFWSAHPDITRARILFVECTFWDNHKPVEHARKWGHLHLDELLALLAKLQNERIVLIHTSARYTTKQLREILAERVPAEHRERVVLFPRP